MSTGTIAPRRVWGAMIAAAWILVAAGKIDASAQEGGESYFHFDSDAGDYIGAGSSYTATPDTAAFQAGTYSGGHVGFSVIEPGMASWWYLEFAAPAGSELTPGAYEGAARWPFQDPAQPGLSVYGNGRGCNRLSGRFDVFEASFGPGGEVLSFHASFEQHCEGAEPALRGELVFVPAPPNALPEGYHDGSEGIQGPSSCTASGWAVDPDDRDQDVTVRVLSDGIEVASRPASDYGQDMYDLNVCPGGTCRFTIDLWGLISPDQAHEITVEAQDLQAGQWETLAASPKSLTCATPPQPSPRITVSITDNWIRAENFQPETGLTYRIRATPESDPAEFVSPSDASGQGFLGSWEHGLDLAPGNLITVSDGSTEKAIVLEEVSLEVFSPDTEYLEGHAPPGRPVWVGVGNASTGCSLEMVADAGSGLWTADFTTVGCDVTADMWAAAQIFDEDGDATEANPVPPPPGVSDWVAAYAYDLPQDAWSEGAHSYHYESVYTVPEPGGSEVTGEIYFTISEDAPMYDGTVLLRPGGVRAPLGGDIDGGCPLLDPYVVNPSQATAFVWGQLTPGPMTAEEAQAHFDSVAVTVTIDEGAETVMLERREIVPWQGLDWWLGYVCSTFAMPEPPPPPPAARLVVFPEAESVHVWDLPTGTDVQLTIDDPAIAGEVNYEDTATVGPAPWDENQILAYFDFAGSFDVKVGDTVTVAYLGTSVAHMVEFVTVTGTDAGEDTVFGQAVAEEPVYVWQHGEDWAMQSPTTGGDGTWTADFTETGLDLLAGACGRAEVRDEQGNSTAHDWCVPFPPNPRFSVFPEWEWIEGFDWPDGVSILTSVDGKPECDGQAIASGGYFHLELGGDCDIVVGDTVILSDGTTTRTHTVRNLGITSVDAADDTVAGTADPGETIYVWQHEPGEQVAVIANDDGQWLADLTGFYDIRPGSSGRSEIRDEVDNGTAVDWYMPNPHFTVFPEWEFFDSYEWPDGGMVTITVAGKPECEVTRESWGGFFNGNFGEGCDVQIGDTVTFTDGISTRTHTVRNLDVTSVDEAEDTVAGTADTGETIYVWQHEPGEQVAVTADDDGQWLADLTGFYDIRPGSEGRSEIRDEAGNATAVDWRVPNPWFTAFLEGEIIEGWEWPLGAVVHMTIDDPDTPEAADFSRDGTVVPAPWDPNQPWLWIEFWDAYDMTPGDIVTLTDGLTERVHTVQELAITSVDPDENTASGTAAPGREVTLWSWEDPEGRRLTTSADDFGLWSADFDDAGFDLVPGHHVRAEAWEGPNDTAVDRDVPLPVTIDIRPWTARNLVFCQATWDLLPVALVSSEAFDATAVDHESVRFGRTGTEAAVATLYGRPLRFSRDVNGDGLADMVYTFRFGETGFGCSDIPAGRYSVEVRATLTGWSGGLYLVGSEPMTLVRLLGH